MSKYVFDYHLLQNAVIITFPEFVDDKVAINAIKKAYWKVTKKKVKFVDRNTFDIISGNKKKSGFVEINDDKIYVNILDDKIVEFEKYEIDKKYKLLMENDKDKVNVVESSE